MKKITDKNPSDDPRQVMNQKNKFRSVVSLLQENRRRDYSYSKKYKYYKSLKSKNNNIRNKITEI